VCLAEANPPCHCPNLQGSQQKRSPTAPLYVSITSLSSLGSAWDSVPSGKLTLRRSRSQTIFECFACSAQQYVTCLKVWHSIIHVQADWPRLRQEWPASCRKEPGRSAILAGWASLSGFAPESSAVTYTSLVHTRCTWSVAPFCTISSQDTLPSIYNSLVVGSAWPRLAAKRASQTREGRGLAMLLSPLLQAMCLPQFGKGPHPWRPSITRPVRLHAAWH
jgi:hypothetical protein